jgi:hypothetical protein
LAQDRHARVGFDEDAMNTLMNTFRKSAPAKSLMFALTYDDARTAYLWVDNASKADDERLVGSIARLQQEQGTLPPGTIIRIKRVR